MPELMFDQSNFTGGQIDKRMQARTDMALYHKAAKTLKNCLIIPQGGITKRFGTTFVDEVDLTPFEQTSYKYSEISKLIYDNDVIYLLLWTRGKLKIYLQDKPIAVLDTPYQAEDIDILRFGQVENRMVITHGNFKPRQLIRSSLAANGITAFDGINHTLTATSALTPSQVLPVTFATDNTLPQTSPKIYSDRPYFIRVRAGNTFSIYASPLDAAQDVNRFMVSSAGLGTNSVLIQNAWALTEINFTFSPSFDFKGQYNNLTFTPSAINGAALTITASGPIFTSAHVGGTFNGNGGIVRINTVNSPTSITCQSLEDFTDTSAIKGTLAFLGEPAWSDARGWPRHPGFYQNRLVFGGSPSIPNGAWLSVTNEAYNFDDSESLDDNAISWYPAGGSISEIRSISSGRSLIFHTNTGTFSSPVGNEAPVTPRNFTLIEQNKMGSNGTEALNIDNQVIYVDQSGNNVLSLIWEVTQNAFVVRNISVMASDLIHTPIDTAAFTNPNHIDGSFVILVNADGTLAIFQTLVEQEVGAWSTANTQTSTPNPKSFFQRVTSCLGEAWFLVKRQVVNAGITSYKTYLERLDFEAYTDCTLQQDNLLSPIVTKLEPLNGSTPQMVGDGCVLTPHIVVGGTLTLPNAVSSLSIGHQINSALSFLPVSNFVQGIYNFYKAKHIRSFYIKYYQTIGALIQGYDLPVQNLQDVALDVQPMPQDGIYQYTLMEGWDSHSFDISITQDLPLPMTILGISYVMET